MVSWNPWIGLDINDTWSLAYEWKQKFGVHELASYIMLGIFLIILIIMIFWMTKGKLYIGACLKYFNKYKARALNNF